MRQLLKSSLVLFSAFALVVAFQNCSRDSFQSRLPSKLDQAANDQLDLPSDDFADEDILGRDDIFNIPQSDNASSNSSENTAEDNASALAIAATASGKVYYVATNGSDTNSGTISKPFKTVQRAVKIVKPGDTVLIRKGRHAPFSINNLNGTATARITFRGETGAVIDKYVGGTNSISIQFFGVNSYITIDNLVLTSSDPRTETTVINCVTTFIKDSESYKGGALKINHVTVNGKSTISHHLIFSKLEMTTFLGQADDSQLLNSHIHHGGNIKTNKVGYGTYLGGRRWLIRGNRINNSNGHGIRTGNSSSPQALLVDSVIENNLIYNNGGKGAHNTTTGCRMIYGGDGIIIYGGSGNIVRNNVISGNHGYGIRVRENFLLNKIPNLVYNNTVYKNGYAVNKSTYEGIYCYSADKTIVRNNIVYLSGKANISSNCSQQSNNLTIDPKFVNVGALDFRLQAGSPAIDKGVALKEVTKDFSGVARPQGKGYDMGAYEK